MQTSCSQCGTSMICGVQEKSCWCMALPVLPASTYQSNVGCLCANCLQRRLEAGVVMYGIPNCDTVKKARAWLTEQGVAHAFWDYKKHGVPQALIQSALTTHGWQTVCNTRGPTWRNIPEPQRLAVADAATARTVLNEHPSAIKRPIVSWGNTYAQQLTVGFDAALWQGIIKI